MGWNIPPEQAKIWFNNIFRFCWFAHRELHLYQVFFIFKRANHQSKALHHERCECKVISNWYTIKIIISDNYSTIHVHCKDGFNQFNRLQISNVYYIVMQSFTQEKNDNIPFSSSNNISKYSLFPNSIMYTLGNHIAKKIVNAPYFLEVYYVKEHRNSSNQLCH